MRNRMIGIVVMSVLVGVGILAAPASVKCSGNSCEWDAEGIGTALIGEGDQHPDYQNSTWPDRNLARDRAGTSAINRCYGGGGSGCSGYTDCGLESEGNGPTMTTTEVSTTHIAVHSTVRCKCFTEEEYNQPQQAIGRVPAPVPSFFTPIRQFTDWLVGRKAPKAAPKRIGG